MTHSFPRVVPGTQERSRMPSNAQHPLVEFDTVDFGYDASLVLRGVCLRVDRGQVVAIMGASGGGKTTALRLIGGQVRASAGTVRFDGIDLAHMRHAELFAARRRMGMLFQMGALFTDQTVFDNVAFALREHTDLPASMIRDLVLMKLQAVGLRGARDLYPAQLSGGMALRVAMARAVVLDPALVMYDEPFAGLDPISLGITARLIRTLNDALGLTSIVVSHDVDETFAIADRVFVLGNGTLIAEGTPDELRGSHDPLVRQFVRGEPDGPVRFHYAAAPVESDLLTAAGGRR